MGRLYSFRSSHSKIFFKIAVLKNLPKFKITCGRIFYKVSGLQPTTDLKNRLLRRCFSEIFAKF